MGGLLCKSDASGAGISKTLEGVFNERSEECKRKLVELAEVGGLCENLWGFSTDLALEISHFCGEDLSISGLARNLGQGPNSCLRDDCTPFDHCARKVHPAYCKIHSCTVVSFSNWSPVIHTVYYLFRASHSIAIDPKLTGIGVGMWQWPSHKACNSILVACNDPPLLQTVPMHLHHIRRTMPTYAI